MFFQRSSSAAPPPAADLSSPDGAPAAPPVSPPAVTGGSGPVILVVDDSAMIRAAVIKALATQHYETLQADDGVNGLAAWEKDAGRITLVLSDVFMPRMDGLTMAREIRRRSRTVPVLLMSSKLDEDSRWVAEEAGFRLLPKPFRDAYLLELVARMIRMRGAAG